MPKSNVAESPAFDPRQGFYPRDIASRLADVSRKTMAEWDKKGIVPALIHWTDPRGRETPAYTFEGLVYLRLIRLLRQQKNSVPMRRIIVAVEYLVEKFGPPGPEWEGARIFSDGKRIWVDKPTLVSASDGGQIGSEVLLGKEFARFRARADALLVPEDFLEWVEIQPSLRNGMPVVRGSGMETRIIHAMFNQGMNERDVKASYPFLSLTQIRHGEGFEKYLDDRKLALAP